MSTPDLKPATTYPAIVGQVLVALRQMAELSQAQVAAALGVTQATWSRIERAGSAMTIDQLAVVAKVLQSTPGNILEVADIVATLVERRGISLGARRWEVVPTVADSVQVAISPDALVPFVQLALARAVAAPPSAAEREGHVTELIAQASEEYYKPGADNSLTGMRDRAIASAKRKAAEDVAAKAAAKAAVASAADDSSSRGSAKGKKRTKAARR